MALIGFVTIAGSGAVSGALNTVGATLLVAYGAAGAAPTLTDSQGNTWTTDASVGGGNPPFHTDRFLYVVNPTTNAAHTFQVFGSNVGIVVAAFDGTLTSSAFDVRAGTSGTGTTTLNPGSVTPTTPDSLILSGLGIEQNRTESINSGFTIVGKQNFNSGINYAVVLAYKIVTGTSPVDPQWSWTGGNGDVAGVNLVIKAAASGGGGGPAPTPVAPQMGSGGVIFLPGRVVAF